ncbi:MAG: CBS domain-containing protein [Rhodoplanes sp.]
MKAADIMATEVVTVTPESTVQEVAEILLKNRISGAPVVDPRGRVVGIVSEGDLLRRAEAAPDTSAHGGLNSRWAARGSPPNMCANTAARSPM